MKAFAKCAGLVLSLAALATATTARAAEAPCLTPSDLDAVFAYGLPTVIDAAGQACRPVLAPGGFLATQGADLAARYRVGQAAAWPLAKAAVLKVGVGALGAKGVSRGIGKLAAVLPDSALQGFAAGFVSQYVISAVHPADCPDIEYALRMIAPLPPENTAGLITLVIERLEHRRAENKAPPHGLRIPLCPARSTPLPAPKP